MIEVKSLDYRYQDGTKALDQVNMDLNKGRIIGLAGANGSGKSTLFLNLMGILKPSGGGVYYKGTPLKYKRSFLNSYREKVTLVFQDPEKQLFFPRVYDDLAFPLRNLGLGEGKIRKQVEEALRKVRAYDLIDKPTHFLSFGEKKRIALAGALALDTEVILLDEPTSGLDPQAREELARIIKGLSRDKKIVLSSHNMDLLYEICEYVYILGKGKVLGEGPVQEVFLQKDLLERAYLSRPWLVRLHEELGLPLYKNEEELFKYKGEEIR